MANEHFVLEVVVKKVSRVPAQVSHAGTRHTTTSDKETVDRTVEDVARFVIKGQDLHTLVANGSKHLELIKDGNDG